ncbi:heavy-metal-associated domain-containing protein [Brevundimonas faecalis]|uniref:Copper chaperone n=1 Tax=Brevundimonas faecalis TaxID=947378 RepID=A0ABV2RER5_9CAUL
MIALTIPKIRCEGCVASVEKAVASVDPAAVVKTDIEARRVEVATEADRQTLLTALASAGYPAEEA